MRKGVLSDMKKERIELVAKYCPEDCVYRVVLESYLLACYYAAIENEVRGCKVSECNRYRGGKPKKPTMDREYMIYWEYEYYGEDDNPLW